MMQIVEGLYLWDRKLMEKVNLWGPLGNTTHSWTECTNYSGIIWRKLLHDMLIVWT